MQSETSGTVAELQERLAFQEQHGRSLEESMTQQEVALARLRRDNDALATERDSLAAKAKLATQMSEEVTRLMKALEYQEQRTKGTNPFSILGPPLIQIPARRSTTGTGAGAGSGYCGVNRCACSEAGAKGERAAKRDCKVDRC